MATRKGNRVFVWIILILLFVGLIGFGATGLSGHVTRLGTVGDKEIPVQDYATALQRQMRAFEAQTGQSMSLAQAQGLGLDQAVLAQLVTDRVMDDEAGDLGLSVGDARVRDQVLQVQAFRGLDGQFDRDAYREALSRNGTSVADFETSLREQEARSLLQGAVIGGVAAPSAYAEAMVEFLMERRDITWAPLTADALAEDPAAPTDAEIQARYEAAPEAYTAPEVRNITYAWLTPEMLGDSVEVDEAQLRELYQQRISDYVQEERRLVERLVYPSEEAATAALATLGEPGTDFETLVEARGLDLAAVDLGDLAKADLGAAGDAVFAAAAGDVVGPLETSLGPALFRVNAVLAAEEIPFEQARADLQAELAQARARRMIQDASEQITDLLAGGASLEDLAERSDMELGSIEWTEGDAEGIAAYAPFRDAALAAKEGDFPELGEFEDGGVFALRLDGVTAPAVQPLDEVRDRVIADLLDAATDAAVLQLAEDLAGQIADGASFADLGLAPRQVPNLTRRDFVEATPNDFVAQVYQMDSGAVRALPGSDQAGAVIVRLDKIAPPAKGDPAVEAELKSIEERIAAGMAQDLYAAFAGEVQSDTEIRIDDAAVQAVHNSFR